MSEKIQVSMDEKGIARLVMNDRQGNNTFSEDFIAETVSGIERAEKMRPRVMILAGLKDVFCAGAEKKSLMDLCDGQVRVSDLIISDRLLDVSFPVIAAMEGHAIGGGLLMALCCDIILAARESRFGAVFMQLGFTPGMGCTTLLAELVGHYLAFEMMFTGKRFKGRELAEKSTNINYILPREEILPKAEDLALQICDKSPEVLYLLKRTLNVRRKKMLIEARNQEELMHQISFARPETREKIEEFYAGRAESEDKS